MNGIDWQKHYRPDGSLNLQAAFEEGTQGEVLQHPGRAKSYLDEAQRMAKFTSRQAASLAILEAHKRATTGPVEGEQ